MATSSARYGRPVGAVHPAFGDVVKLLILTGQRLGEIARLTWTEYHEATGEIRLSGDRTKNRRAHIIPLPDAARTIIDSRDRINGCPYVFSITGKTPVSGISKWKDDLDKQLSFETPWHLHDLRHVVSTGMNELEVEPHVVEAVLNHVSGFRAGVAGRYNSFHYLPQKRVALARWGAHVKRLVAPPAGKIVRLRAGASVGVTEAAATA